MGVKVYFHRTLLQAVRTRIEQTFSLESSAENQKVAVNTIDAADVIIGGVRLLAALDTLPSGVKVIIYVEPGAAVPPLPKGIEFFHGTSDLSPLLKRSGIHA